jgi:hypothetical protein
LKKKQSELQLLKSSIVTIIEETTIPLSILMIKELLEAKEGIDMVCCSQIRT